MNIRTSQTPEFSNIPRLMATEDLRTLYSNSAYHCTTLWHLISWPMSLLAWQATITIISILDDYLCTHIIRLLNTPETAYFLYFALPVSPCKPSIIFQVSSSEKTVNPYVLALRSNYYYPLPTMLDDGEDTTMSSTAQLSSLAPDPAKLSTVSTPSQTKVMVEDSLKVITELIQELQSSDEVLAIHNPSDVDSLTEPQVTNLTKSTASTIRFSLVHTTRTTVTGTTNLTLSKNFFHCLLSVPSTSILPIRNGNPVAPLKTTFQINELSSVGLKSFFHPNRASRNDLNGNFHIKTSLPFNDLKAHPKITNWLVLNGYNVIHCECQDSDMIRIGFLSCIRPFLWRDDLHNYIKSTQEWQSTQFSFCL